MLLAVGAGGRRDGEPALMAAIDCVPSAGRAGLGAGGPIIPGAGPVGAMRCRSPERRCGRIDQGCIVFIDNIDAAVIGVIRVVAGQSGRDGVGKLVAPASVLSRGMLRCL